MAIVKFLIFAFDKSKFFSRLALTPLFSECTQEP